MRPSLSLALPLLCTPLAAACSDPVPDPKTIAIETDAPPALIAFRHDDSPTWQTVAISGATNEVTATGPYRVVIACELASGTIFIVEHARTLDDDGDIYQPCDDATATPFTVRGTLAQPGRIARGDDTAFVAQFGGSFELSAAAGTADLVLFSVGSQIAIRRDVRVTGDLELGAVDSAMEGAQGLVPVTFTATNAPSGDALSAFSSLDVAGTSTHIERIDQLSWTVALAPDRVLRPTDHQRVLLVASEASDSSPVYRNRTIQREVRVGDPTTVTLPERLGPVTFAMTPDRLEATWSTLFAFEGLAIARDGGDDQRGWIHELTLSRSFIEETGAKTAVLDLTSVPGIQDAWRVDPAKEHGRQLIAFSGAPNAASASSLVYEELNTPGARVSDGGATARVREIRGLHERALRTRALRPRR